MRSLFWWCIDQHAERRKLERVCPPWLHVLLPPRTQEEEEKQMTSRVRAPDPWNRPYTSKARPCAAPQPRRRSPDVRSREPGDYPNTRLPSLPGEPRACSAPVPCSCSRDDCSATPVPLQGSAAKGLSDLRKLNEIRSKLASQRPVRLQRVSVSDD